MDFASSDAINLPDDDHFPYAKLGRAVATFNSLEGYLADLAASLVAPFGAVTNAVVSDLSLVEMTTLAERAAAFGVVAPPIVDEFKPIIAEARNLNRIRNKWVHAQVFSMHTGMIANRRHAQRAGGAKAETVSDEEFEDFFGRCEQLARRCREFTMAHRTWWRENPPPPSPFA